MSLRALGGGELHGNKLVRLVYLDESGVSSQRQEPYLVVGGVLVHGDHQLGKLESALEEILVKHIPEHQREGLTLHTAEIYGGYGKIFDKRKHPEWTIDKRMAILADLAALPKKLNLYAVFAHIERAKFPQTFTLAPGEKSDLTVEAHVCAFMSCVVEVEMWFRQNAKQEHCLVIVENNERSRKLLKETQRYYQNKNLTKELSEDHKKFLPLHRVKEDAAFQTKRPSHPLVLADFIAFVAKRFVMNDPRILPYFAPWKERNAVLGVTMP